MSSDHDRLRELLALTVIDPGADPVEAKKEIDELAIGRTPRAAAWYEKFRHHNDPSAELKWHWLKAVVALDQVKREIRQLASKLFPDLGDTDQLEAIMQRAKRAARTNGETSV